MSVLKILSNIKKRILYGTTTLDGFIELCKQEDAPFIDIWDWCFDSFGDLYQVKYQSPTRRNFSETISRVPFYDSNAIFDLESEKTNIKTLERVLEAAEKIEKAGIKALHMDEPINKSKLKETRVG